MRRDGQGVYHHMEKKMNIMSSVFKKPVVNNLFGSW
jgi:hypothetical protein